MRHLSTYNYCVVMPYGKSRFFYDFPTANNNALEMSKNYDIPFLLVSFISGDTYTYLSGRLVDVNVKL